MVWGEAAAAAAAVAWNRMQQLTRELGSYDNACKGIVEEEGTGMMMEEEGVGVSARRHAAGQDGMGERAQILARFTGG